MDDLTKEFLAESTEGLDRMDQCLTELERHPGDGELLGEIFRAVHTIKGTTGFLGFGRLERLAHAGESLLGSLRDGRLVADSELISGLLQLMDGLRAILICIEQTGSEGVRSDQDDAGLIALLVALNAPAGTARMPQTTPLVEQAAPLPNLVEDLAVKPVTELQQTVIPPSASSSSEKTLRIDVDVLNRMMNLVGELVLTRNQMLQSHVDAANFPQLTRRLDSVTADLRETVMQARMQPVGHLFGKFPRMVRDLAKTCGKQVRIEFVGETTGLDKSLLEAIKDPLTHAVRNAVDHGVESPERRLAAGKPAEGVVRLTACHQSGSVLIEVSDDGGGIPPKRLLAKALERGLITPDQASQMSPREVLQLIFLPGFSTAEELTKVSGRGVGMDVVRANVESVNGTVEVESREGEGTTLRLRVPLTMAIVPALVVRSGGQSFCLPQGSLAELVYVPQREAKAAIERIGDAELYRLRDQLLPMVWLDRILGLVPAHSELGFYLAVLEAEGCRYGLVVDDLMAPEEIVVKPLSPVLREIGLFLGATVLGNGTLAMILDVAAAAARARVRPVAEQAGMRELERQVSDISLELGAATSVKGQSFLIYEDASDDYVPGRERRALPLEVVERIERVRMGDIERVAGRPLLQYRGDLLPLEDAGGVLHKALRGNPEATMTVLICDRTALAAAGLTSVPVPRGIDSRGTDGASGKRSRLRVGLVVERVVDVASGSFVERSAEVCEERLALVKDRLAVLHGGFGRETYAGFEAASSTEPVSLAEVA